jgi:hypothetical protein
MRKMHGVHGERFTGGGRAGAAVRSDLRVEARHTHAGPVDQDLALRDDHGLGEDGGHRNEQHSVASTVLFSFPATNLGTG